MGWLGGLIGMAVLIGLCVVISNAWDAAKVGFNRNVLYRDKYSRVMTEIKEPTAFITDLPPDKAICAIGDRVGDRPSEALLRVGVTVREVSATSLIISLGNRLSRSYVCAVSAERHGEKTYVNFKVVQWEELNGVPNRIDDFYQLKADIEAALLYRDTNTHRLTALTDPHQPTPTHRICVWGPCQMAGVPQTPRTCPHCGQQTQPRHS